MFWGGARMTESKYYVLRLAYVSTKKSDQKYIRDGWLRGVYISTFEGGYGRVCETSSFNEATIYSSEQDAKDDASKVCPLWAKLEVVPLVTEPALPYTVSRK